MFFGNLTLTNNYFKADKLKPSTNFITGPEAITSKTVCDFWQWSFSNLMQNTTRGILAEYIVASLLGIDNEVRDPWFPYDLRLPNGPTIEIKTMSCLQAWKQKQLSKPTVVIRPTRAWNPNTGEINKEKTFNADLYIICYFKATKLESANPLDLSQWQFYVFTKKELIRLLEGRKSISLTYLEKKEKKPLTAHELKKAVLSI